MHILERLTTSKARHGCVEGRGGGTTRERWTSRQTNPARLESVTH